jgi:hypothetical protein
MTISVKTWLIKNYIVVDYFLFSSDVDPMNTFVTGAERWLKSKHINAPNDWLEACIEWIKDENEV